MNRERVALTLVALGVGLIVGALYEGIFKIERTASVCEKDGSCTKHYAAPQFALLILVVVLVILGVALIAVGARVKTTKPKEPVPAWRKDGPRL